MPTAINRYTAVRGPFISERVTVRSEERIGKELTGDRAATCLSVCLDLSPSHGGSYRAAVDLAEASGSPIVSFRDGTGQLAPEPLAIAVREVDVAQWSAWSRYVRPPRREAARLAELAGRPAILYAHSLFRSHAAWVRELAARQGVPYVAIPHGSLDPWVFQRRRLGKCCWMQWIGRDYLSNAALVMFSTDAERKKAEQTLGLELRSVVVRWPVDVRPFRPSAEEQRTARAHLGLPGDKRILLYFGRYHSMKRPIETVQAFLGAAPPEAMLVMAGMDGDLSADSLRAAAGEAGARRVRVLGPVFGEQRSNLLAAVDAFVSWSHRENFCYAAAEAMGFGRPAILSPGNDLRGELGESRCGWFPEHAATANLAEAIRGFGAVGETELAAMGVAAHDAAKRLFSRRAFCAAIAAIQNQLIG